MQHVLSVALVVVAIIHLLPLPGLLGASKLEVYGISIAELLVSLRGRRG